MEYHSAEGKHRKHCLVPPINRSLVFLACHSQLLSILYIFNHNCGLEVVKGDLCKPAQRRKDSSWVCVLTDPVSFPCSAFTHPVCDLALGFTNFICNMRTRVSLGKGGEWGRLWWKKTRNKYCRSCQRCVSKVEHHLSGKKSLHSGCILPCCAVSTLLSRL